MMYSDYGVMVSWDNINNVRVTVLGRYLNKTSGLCGTFNKISSDDFLTSTGTTETDAVDFGNSWKTDPSCVNATTVEHPCKTHPERKWIAQKNCSALIRYPFSLCNQTVSRSKLTLLNVNHVVWLSIGGMNRNSRYAVSVNFFIRPINCSKLKCFHIPIQRFVALWKLWFVFPWNIWKSLNLNICR